MKYIDDINEVKKIFLEVLDKHYIGLSNQPISNINANHSNSFFSLWRKKKYGSSAQTYELDNLKAKVTVDDLNNGNVYSGQPRNRGTGQKGREKLYAFFDRLKDTKSTQEIIQLCGQKQFQQGINFPKALAKAIVLCVELECIDGSFEPIDGRAYSVMSTDEMANLIILEARDELPNTVHSLQQWLYAKYPHSYRGNPKLYQRTELLKRQVEAEEREVDVLACAYATPF